MYNGVGLQTPRGSGTNGYIQKSLAFVKPKRTDMPADEFSIKKIPSLKIKAADESLLEHERKRKIEIDVLKFEDSLRDEGVNEDTINKKSQDFRKKLKEEQVAFTANKHLQKNHDQKMLNTHEIAALKEEEMKRVADAFKISHENYKPGSAFDFEAKRLEKIEAQEKRRKKELEIEKQLKKMEASQNRAKYGKKKAKEETSSDSSSSSSSSDDESSITKEDTDTKKKVSKVSKSSTDSSSDSSSDESSSSSSDGSSTSSSGSSDNQSQYVKEKEHSSPRNKSNFNLSKSKHTSSTGSPKKGFQRTVLDDHEIKKGINKLSKTQNERKTSSSSQSQKEFDNSAKLEESHDNPNAEPTEMATNKPTISSTATYSKKDAHDHKTNKRSSTFASSRDHYSSRYQHREKTRSPPSPKRYRHSPPPDRSKRYRSRSHDSMDNVKLRRNKDTDRNDTNTSNRYSRNNNSHNLHKSRRYSRSSS